MPRIIQNNQIIDDPYCFIADKETTDMSVITDNHALLPFAVWRDHKQQLPDQGNKIWLDSDEPCDLLADDIDAFSLIAINFPVFTDGRGYSYAFRLRKAYHFQGQIRAVGDVLLDQLTAMQRVGFNSFSLREDQDIHAALNHFNDFKHPYQASIIPDRPLFRQ